MSQLNRLYASQIANGQLIDADHLNAEYNQLVNESNSQDTRIDDMEALGHTTTNISVDTISERTAANGVTVDSVLHKDGAIRLNPTAGYTPTGNGDIGYDSTAHAYKVMVNGVATSLVTGGGIASQSEMEAASSTTALATAGNLTYHPGVAKAFFVGTMSGTTLTTRRAYGCSVTRSGTGTFTVTLTPNASDAYYAVAGSVIDGATNGGWVSTTSKATTGFTLITRRADTQAGADFAEFSFVVYGDL